MKLRLASVCVFASLCMVLLACSKQAPRPELLIEIPAGFSGNFVLEMGVHGAPPLGREGQLYKAVVQRSGKVETSTSLENPLVKYKNDSGSGIWGFSQSRFTTGDGISVGGKIEFFVGTQKQFEAEQNKKNKSGGSLADDLASIGA